MKVGLERNKVLLLIAVWVVLGATVYLQFFSGQAPRGPVSPAAAARPAPAPNPEAASRSPQTRRAPVSTRGGTFRPRFGGESDEVLDPLDVDPTLRTDLLLKVQQVPFEGIERNLFVYGERKKAVPPPSEEAVREAQQRLAALSKPKPPPAAEAAKPQPPPIRLKYYGFASRPGDRRRRAFLLDGEEIVIAGEGDILKKRFKVIRISAGSVVVEDIQNRQQQTLRLEQS
jgi:hypothetical protein